MASEYSENLVQNDAVMSKNALICTIVKTPVQKLESLIFLVKECQRMISSTSRTCIP